MKDSMWDRHLLNDFDGGIKVCKVIIRCKRSCVYTIYLGVDPFEGVKMALGFAYERNVSWPFWGMTRARLNAILHH